MITFRLWLSSEAIDTGNQGILLALIRTSGLEQYACSAENPTSGLLSAAVLTYFLFTFFSCVVPMGNSGCLQSRATQPTVHAGCFSVSIIHRTLTLTTGSLTCAQMLIHAVVHRVHRHRERVLFGKLTLEEKNLLPHRGIEPAWAACRSDAPPTELHPTPQGTQQQRPESPTVTLPGMRVNTRCGTSSAKALFQFHLSAESKETVSRSYGFQTHPVWTCHPPH